MHDRHGRRSGREGTEQQGGNDVAHLIYGETDIEGRDGGDVQTQVLSGSHSGFGFIGGRATGLGDINGDGIGDMAVSAYFANAFTGRVYLYFGVDGGQLSGDPDVVIDGLEGSGGGAVGGDG